MFYALAYKITEIMIKYFCKISNFELIPRPLGGRKKSTGNKLQTDRSESSKVWILLNNYCVLQGEGNMSRERR